jgi:DNA-binding NarL/FixJ family response regulator
MFCSARTVESYRDALFGKLGVKTRVALALYAVKAGLYKL